MEGRVVVERESVQLRDIVRRCELVRLQILSLTISHLMSDEYVDLVHQIIDKRMKIALDGESCCNSVDGNSYDVRQRTIVEQSIKTIDSILDEQLKRLLACIQNAIKLHRFCEVEIQLASMGNIVSLLGPLFPLVIQHAVSELAQKDIELDKYLSQLLQQYEQIPIEHYFIYRPKRIFESLEAARHHHSRYETAYCSLSQRVVNRFENVIHNRSIPIWQIESAVTMIPADLAAYLGAKLNYIKEDTARFIDGSLVELQHAIELDDIDTVGRLYAIKNYDSSGKALSEVVKDAVHRRMRELKNRLQTLFPESSIELAASVIEKLSLYNQLMSSTSSVAIGIFAEAEKIVLFAFNKILMNIRSSSATMIHCHDDFIVKNLGDNLDFLSTFFSFYSTYSLAINEFEKHVFISYSVLIDILLKNQILLPKDQSMSPADLLDDMLQKLSLGKQLDPLICKIKQAILFSAGFNATTPLSSNYSHMDLFSTIGKKAEELLWYSQLLKQAIKICEDELKICQENPSLFLIEILRYRKSLQQYLGSAVFDRIEEELHASILQHPANKESSLLDGDPIIQSPHSVMSATAHSAMASAVVSPFSLFSNKGHMQMLPDARLKTGLSVQKLKKAVCLEKTNAASSSSIEKDSITAESESQDRLFTLLKPSPPRQIKIEVIAKKPEFLREFEARKLKKV